MKHLAIRLLVSLFTFAFGIASVTVLHAFNLRAALNSPEGREIMQVERQYIQAHLNRDAATLDNILEDGFTIGTRWRVETKGQRLADLGDMDFAFVSLDTDNLDLEISGDTATLKGEARLRVRRDDVVFIVPTYRFTRQYEKRDGRWQIASVLVERR